MYDSERGKRYRCFRKRVLSNRDEAQLVRSLRLDKMGDVESVGRGSRQGALRNNEDPEPSQQRARATDDGSVRNLGARAVPVGRMTRL